MTKQHYDLRLALACYFMNDNFIVPPIYYDHIVNSYNRNKIVWDVEQVAALTLFSAFYDGVFELKDLIYPGHVALIWAENHIDNLNVNLSVAKPSHCNMH